VSGLPCSPATVEKRASIPVFAPGWNSAALVYLGTSAVVSNTPEAPAPFACGWRAGTLSRVKCATCARKCTSCSRMGPSGPMVSELRSLAAGAPLPVVEPVGRLGSSLLIGGSWLRCGGSHGPQIGPFYRRLPFDLMDWIDRRRLYRPRHEKSRDTARLFPVARFRPVRRLRPDWRAGLPSGPGPPSRPGGPALRWSW